MTPAAAASREALTSQYLHMPTLPSTSFEPSGNEDGLNGRVSTTSGAPCHSNGAPGHDIDIYSFERNVRESATPSSRHSVESRRSNLHSSYSLDNLPQYIDMTATSPSHAGGLSVGRGGGVVPPLTPGGASVVSKYSLVAVNTGGSLATDVPSGYTLAGSSSSSSSKRREKAPTPLASPEVELKYVNHETTHSNDLIHPHAIYSTVSKVSGGQEAGDAVYSYASFPDYSLKNSRQGASVNIGGAASPPSSSSVKLKPPTFKPKPGLLKSTSVSSLVIPPVEPELNVDEPVTLSLVEQRLVVGDERGGGREGVRGGVFQKNLRHVPSRPPNEVSLELVELGGDVNISGGERGSGLERARGLTNNTEPLQALHSSIKGVQLTSKSKVFKKQLSCGPLLASIEGASPPSVGGDGGRARGSQKGGPPVLVVVRSKAKGDKESVTPL